MTCRIRTSRLFVAILAGTLAPMSAAAQLSIPPGWRWATDQHIGAPTIDGAIPDSSWRFTTMAPGWHITTRPATVMFHPDAQAWGRYAIESMQILFPGKSPAGYGVFVGGVSSRPPTRGDLPLYGAFGFRTGDDMNLHVTTLDHTRRLAPVPPPRRRP